jgi:hypothetical protein
MSVLHLSLLEDYRACSAWDKKTCHAQTAPYRTVALVWKGAMFLFNEIKSHRFRAAVGHDQRATIKEKKSRAGDNRAPLVRFDGLQ